MRIEPRLCDQDCRKSNVFIFLATLRHFQPNQTAFNLAEVSKTVFLENFLLPCKFQARRPGLLCIYLICCFADCPQNIFGRDNYFYILSDNQTNANNAQSICMKSAAHLAEISSNTTRSDIRLYAVQRHIPPGLFYYRKS